MIAVTILLFIQSIYEFKAYRGEGKGQEAETLTYKGSGVGLARLCASCVNIACTYWNAAPRSMVFQRSLNKGHCIEII